MCAHFDIKRFSKLGTTCQLLRSFRKSMAPVFLYKLWDLLLVFDTNTALPIGKDFEHKQRKTKPGDHAIPSMYITMLTKLCEKLRIPYVRVWRHKRRKCRSVDSGQEQQCWREMEIWLHMYTNKHLVFWSVGQGRVSTHQYGRAPDWDHKKQYLVSLCFLMLTWDESDSLVGSSTSRMRHHRGSIWSTGIGIQPC
jgi:hypothetical protein